MSTNRLNLTFKLETKEERVAFVESYLEAIPFTPTSDELDTMATRGIKRLQAPLRDISSTDLRRMVREGKSIRGLVPDAICNDVKTAYSNVL